MKNKILISFFLVIILIAVPMNLVAQTTESEIELSEETLELFVLALFDVQEVQVDMNTQVQGIMDNAELAPERLIEIHQSMSQGMENDSFSQDELSVYEDTMEEISQIEQEAQIVMIQVVEENGLTVDQYNQIIALSQQDPEFMEKIQQIIATLSS